MLSQHNSLGCGNNTHHTRSWQASAVLSGVVQVTAVAEMLTNFTPCEQKQPCALIAAWMTVLAGTGSMLPVCQVQLLAPLLSRAEMAGTTGGCHT